MRCCSVHQSVTRFNDLGQLFGTAPTSAIALGELAILATAAHQRSEFERHAHETIGRAVGLADEVMSAIWNDDIVTLDDPYEQCVFATARTLARDGDLNDEMYAEARNTLGDRALVELSTLVGYYSLLALQLRLFRVMANDAS